MIAPTEAEHLIVDRTSITVFVVCICPVLTDVYNFNESNIVVMIDDSQHDKMLQPTKKNLVGVP